MRNTIGAGVSGLLVGLTAAAALLAGTTALGDSDTSAVAESERVRALEEKVARLEEQVEQLQALKPTFAAFMPKFSERFHVLHVAGEVGDWRVARHELLEMQRLVDVSEAVDAERGRMFQGFMNGPLSRINAAIEHEDTERFIGALDDTIDNCNACHQASGSGFVRVTVDIPSVLSMRHAHELTESSLEGMEHTHEH